MFDIGHPIIGDRKYEAQGNPLRRMGLHAYRLIIQNPETKKLMTFSSAMPHSFYRITNIKPKALEALLKDYTK
jgi:23S rRNA pseudouridine1911/1915/1917 synthase